jgi:hypothetical protein
LLRHPLDEPSREGDLLKNDLEVSPLRADLPIEGKGGRASLKEVEVDVTPDLLGRPGIVRDAEGRYCIYLQRVGEQLNVLPESGTYRSLDEARARRRSPVRRRSCAQFKSDPCLEHFASATFTVYRTHDAPQKYHAGELPSANAG